MCFKPAKTLKSADLRKIEGRYFKGKGDGQRVALSNNVCDYNLVLQTLLFKIAFQSDVSSCECKSEQSICLAQRLGSCCTLQTYMKLSTEQNVHYKQCVMPAAMFNPVHVWDRHKPPSDPSPARQLRQQRKHTNEINESESKPSKLSDIISRLIDLCVLKWQIHSLKQISSYKILCKSIRWLHGYEFSLA